MNNPSPVRGVGLGRLLLALDRTMVDLVVAPDGLDRRVASVALLVPDDVHLGLGRAARGADLHLLVGIADDAVLSLLDDLADDPPVAILCKAPSDVVTDRAAALGIAVVEVDAHARWERIYHVVWSVLDTAAQAVGGDESMRSGTTGDLFDLAGQVAQRTGGLVSIEDTRSHVLAYSTAGDEADELRRLSILGREGPPEMLAWLRQWGVMDAVRTTVGVVAVDARTDLGLRPRLAIAIREPGDPSTFLGTIWLQQGRDDLADDSAEILAGASAVAARVIERRRTAGSAHDEVVRRLLGGRGPTFDVDDVAGQLGVAANTEVVVVGFAVLGSAETGDGAGDPPAPVPPAQVSALTLHASALSPLSVTGALGGRVYTVLPRVGLPRTQEWAHAAVDAANRRFGRRVRAVIGGPAPGLASVPALRSQVDRVLDAAERENELIDEVATVDASQTGVLLGEILAHLAANPELVDTRVIELADLDARTGSEFTATLRTYLDHFGDVRSASAALHIHPNTLRYRVRRLQAVTGMDLDDPATRLVVALSLRTR